MNEYGILFQSPLFILSFYLGLMFLGAFSTPLWISHVAFGWIIRRINAWETNTRDRLFLPLTRFLDRLGTHPNAVTIFGMVLVCILALGFYYHFSAMALFLIALVAGCSDTADGMLARFSSKVTSLGGALDGIRDGMLLVVLTSGLFFEKLLSPPMLFWFFIGAGVIETLKATEIIVLGRTKGMGRAFRDRCRGEGKLSIDRAKFFFYVTSCLSLLLGSAVGGGVSLLATSLFALAIASIIFSIVAHASMISFELKQNFNRL